MTSLIENSDVDSKLEFENTANVMTTPVGDIQNINISDMSSVMPIPKPLEYVTEVITDSVNQDIPGEIKVSKEGKLLRSYIAYAGYVNDDITSFNVLVEKRLLLIFQAKNINLPDGTFIKVRKVDVSHPAFANFSRDSNMITPMEARNRGLSYTGKITIYVDRYMNNPQTGISEIFENGNTDGYYVGKMPIMINSSKDSVNIMGGDTNTQIKLDAGECPNDPGGYFIIGGDENSKSLSNERIIVKRESLRTKRILIYNDKVSLLAKMVCNTLTMTRSVIIRKNDVNSINAEFNFTRTMGINIIAVFYVIGDKIKDTYAKYGFKVENPFSDINVIINEILMFVPDESHRRKVRYELSETIHVYNTNISNVYQYLYHKLGLTFDGDKSGPFTLETQTQTKEYIYSKLVIDLFPQISLNEYDPNQYVKDLRRKTYMLSFMISRYIQTSLGYIPIDNRDSWANKQIESAGRVLEDFFITVWDELGLQSEEMFKRYINKHSDHLIKPVLQHLKFSRKTTTDSLIKSFKTKWGVKRESKDKNGNTNRSYYKDNYTDIVKREHSVLSLFAQLTRVKTPVNTRAKTNLKNVQMSQLGYIGVFDTPEGEMCGVVKYKAVTCWISIEQDESLVMEIIRNNIHIYDTPSTLDNGAGLGINVNDDDDEDYYNTVMIYNGKFLGWVAGEITYKKLIELRRAGQPSKDVGIVWERENNVIFYYTTAGRPTRPLLISTEDGSDLIINQKELWGADFDDLLREGAVEYIDAWEQTRIKLAMTPNDIYNRIDQISMLKANVEEAEQRLATIETNNSIEFQNNEGLIFLIDGTKDENNYIYMDKNSRMEELLDERQTMADKLLRMKTNNDERRARIINKKELHTDLVLNINKNKLEAVSQAEIKFNNNIEGQTQLINERQNLLETQLAELISEKDALISTVEMKDDQYVNTLADEMINIRKRIKYLFLTTPAPRKVDIIREKIKTGQELTQEEIKINEDVSELNLLKKRRIAIDDELSNYRLSKTYISNIEKDILKYEKIIREWPDVNNVIERINSNLSIDDSDKQFIFANEQLNKFANLKKEYLESPNSFKMYIINDKKIIEYDMNIKRVGKSLETWPSEKQKVIKFLEESKIKSLPGILKKAENQIDLNIEKVLDEIITLEQQIINVNDKISDLQPIVDSEITISSFENFTEDIAKQHLAEAKLTLDMFLMRWKIPYSHSEMDPNAIIGVSASIIPLLNSNAGARNVFQCNQGRQALGIYTSNNRLRFDNATKALAYPTRPLFETQMNKELGLDELPAGQQVYFAIMPMGGNTMEDSIIMKRQAIDRGLFRIVLNRSYSTIVRGNYQVGRNPASEKIGKPSMRPGLREDAFIALDDYGMPRIGAIVEEGQAVIGKVREIINQKTGKIITEDASVYMGVGEKGTIVRVLNTENNYGKQVVRVKVRLVKTPISGDKFASRHAQKSTISLIMDEADMPYNRFGISPDIIFNPHAIPSRMTIAKLIEVLASKVAALTGERVNATAFQNMSTDDMINKFKRILRSRGFNSNGLETMISGKTGRRFTAEIFAGPVYYQALRHHVDEKIQARQRGSIDILTGQPIRGRSKGGAIKFGEMERDAIVSHNEPSVIEDALCGRSDAYRPIICRECGTFAIADYLSEQQKITCPHCTPIGIEPRFATCVIPKANNYLIHVLSAIGIRMRLGTDKLEDIEIDDDEMSLASDDSDIMDFDEMGYGDFFGDEED